MSAENKAICRRILKEYFEEGNDAVADELYPPHHINYTMNIRGPKEWKQFMVPFRIALPDLSFSLEGQLAEGDKVMNRWTARGTHKGKFMGIPATGEKVTVIGFSIARIADGKIVEEWSHIDMFGLLQQLGVIPPMGEAAA